MANRKSVKKYLNKKGGKKDEHMHKMPDGHMMKDSEMKKRMEK